MNATETANLRHVRQFLDAVAGGATGAALSRFYHADVIQREMPNTLNPRGGTSDLGTLLARAAQGLTLLREQQYDVHHELASGDSVAIEAVWTGVLAVAVGALAAGATMTAHLAMFFELEGGRIRAQRNYDCFEPW